MHGTRFQQHILFSRARYARALFCAVTLFLALVACDKIPFIGGGAPAKTNYLATPVAMNDVIYVVHEVGFFQDLYNGKERLKNDKKFFFLVSLTVTNRKRSETKLKTGNFSIVDTNGNTFKSDMQATEHLTQSTKWEGVAGVYQTNTGDHRVLVFSVPKDVSIPYTLRIRDFLFKQQDIMLLPKAEADRLRAEALARMTHKKGERFTFDTITYTIAFSKYTKEIKAEGEIETPKEGSFLVIDFSLQPTDIDARKVRYNEFVVVDASNKRYKPDKRASELAAKGAKLKSLEEPLAPRANEKRKLVFTIPDEKRAYTLHINRNKGEARVTLQQEKAKPPKTPPSPNTNTNTFAPPATVDTNAGKAPTPPLQVPSPKNNPAASIGKTHTVNRKGVLDKMTFTVHSFRYEKSFPTGTMDMLMNRGVYLIVEVTTESAKPKDEIFNENAFSVTDSRNVPYVVDAAATSHVATEEKHTQIKGIYKPKEKKRRVAVFNVPDASETYTLHIKSGANTLDIPLVAEEKN